MKNILNRFKSWATWVSILGAIAIILQATGLFEKLGLTNEMWNTGVTVLGSLLTAFGIVNNPTDKENF